MVDIRLVEYIEKELGKGIKEMHIKQALKTAGHDINFIEEAFEHVNAGHHKRHKKHVLIGGFLAVIIVVGVLMMQTGVFEKIGMSGDDAEPGRAGIVELQLSDTELYNQAIITGNILMCDEIEGRENRASCLMYFSQDEKASEILNEGRDPVEVADENNYEKALSEGNPELCNEIVDESYKESCETFFAPVENNVDPESDEGLYQQALTSGDASICSQIIGEGYKESCYSFFVMPVKEEKNINEMSDEELYEEALITGDSSICRMMTDESYMVSCLTFFA